MSNSGLTTNQISAAGAYAQADRLVATLPIRAIDPTRPRFEVQNQAAAQEAPSQAQPSADAADGDGSSASSQTQGQSSTTTGRFGFGLIGAFTSFLARMFGQDEPAAVSATTSAQSGVEAYARAAGTSQVQEEGAEILSPSFPRLSSGRAVDLVV